MTTRRMRGLAASLGTAVLAVGLLAGCTGEAQTTNQYNGSPSPDPAVGSPTPSTTAETPPPSETPSPSSTPDISATPEVGGGAGFSATPTPTP